MATRQYIGARYVPKFYENPDTQDATWKSGVVYEPLTMVMYNSATYTSKREVPQTVGDPAANPDYWVATGNYNGQIAYLQSEIGTLADLDTDNKNSLVEAINEVVTDLNKKTIINQTVTPENGNFEYIGCTIADIASETQLTGRHVFKNCNIGDLFIKGGEYEFYNCTYDFIRLVNSKGIFKGCTGGSIILTEACDNSVIDGCTITANHDEAGLACNGSIADNIKIINNEIVNTQPDATGIHQECINAHGITNSIIVNNICTRLLPGSLSDPATAIDLDGHAVDSTIRCHDVLVYGNITNGDITIYACKNVKVANNTTRCINFNGEFDALDYGQWDFTNNTTELFKMFMGASGTPTSLIINLVNNIIKTYGCVRGSVLSGATLNMYGNTVKGVLIDDSTQLPNINLPVSIVYIPAGGKVWFPTCYVLASEIAAVTANTVFNGGVVENATAQDRYIRYQQININNGNQNMWTQ